MGKNLIRSGSQSRIPRTQDGGLILLVHICQYQSRSEEGFGSRWYCYPLARKLPCIRHKSEVPEGYQLLCGPSKNNLKKFGVFKSFQAFFSAVKPLASRASTSRPHFRSVCTMERLSCQFLSFRAFFVSEPDAKGSRHLNIFNLDKTPVPRDIAISMDGIRDNIEG